MKPDTIYTLEAFLWLATILLARSREIRVWQVVVISLAGFYVAFTPLGYVVNDTVAALMKIF